MTHDEITESIQRLEEHKTKLDAELQEREKTPELEPIKIEILKKIKIQIDEHIQDLKKQSE
jgi:hypothetical protein